MKKYILVAAFLVVALAFFGLSRTAFAQTTGTTGGGSTDNSGCTLIDPQDDLFRSGTNGTGGSVPVTGGTNSSGGASSTSAATSTSAAPNTSAATSTPLATDTPMATATQSSSSAATSTPLATATQNSSGSGSSGSGSATNTPMPTATQSSSGSGGSVPVTGSTREPHETPFCFGNVKADVALPRGGSAAFASANIGNFSTDFGFSGSTQGSTSSSNSMGAGDYAATLNVSDGQGGQVKAAHMEVCFVDPTQSSNIYFWMSSSAFASDFNSTTTAARWLRLPTSHTGNMACIQTWLPGTFALH